MDHKKKKNKKEKRNKINAGGYDSWERLISTTQKKSQKKNQKKKKKRQTIFLIQNSYKTMTCTTMPFRTRTGPFVTSNRKSAFRKKKKISKFFFWEAGSCSFDSWDKPPRDGRWGIAKVGKS